VTETSRSSGTQIKGRSGRKESSAQPEHELMLYDRALHPELFHLRGRRRVSRPSYELECWLTESGHALRFERHGVCVSEVVTDRPGSMPESGVVARFSVAGDHDFDHAFADTGINYMTTVQTEHLSQNLFLSTLDEMRSYARDVEALTHEWPGEQGGGRGGSLSVLDVQRFNKEVHVQGYHLMARGGAVLRTQTIFEHK